MRLVPATCRLECADLEAATPRFQNDHVTEQNSHNNLAVCHDVLGKANYTKPV